MKVPTTTRMMAMMLAGAVLTGPMVSGTAMAATKKPATAQKAAPAPEADPALTRDAARAHAVEIFDRLDFNHDGTFNAADHQARRAARLGEQFDRLDANHDGSVTKAEFIAAHTRGPDAPGNDTPPPPGDHGRMDRPGRGPGGPGPMGGDGPRGPMISPMVFDILRDADPQHTGSVTKDAFIAAELKRFDAADTNHDGKVTREELRASRHDDRRGDHGNWGPRGGRDGWRHDGPDRDGPDHGGPRHGRPDGDTPPPPPAPAPAK